VADTESAAAASERSSDDAYPENNDHPTAIRNEEYRSAPFAARNECVTISDGHGTRTGHRSAVAPESNGEKIHSGGEADGLAHARGNKDLLPRQHCRSGPHFRYLSSPRREEPWSTYNLLFDPMDDPNLVADAVKHDF